MSNWKTSLAVISAVLVVAGAGYYGFRSARGQEDNHPVQAPPTVSVTKGDVQETVDAPGQVVGTKDSVLGMTVGGTLSEIDVRPGDVVHAGEFLAKLDTKPLADALATARLKVTQAQADNANQLTQAQLAQQIAKAQLKQAQESAPTTTAAEASLAQAQANLANDLKGPDPESLTKARADVDNARAALVQAQSAYDKVAWRGDIAASPEAVNLEKATNDYAIAKATYDQLTTQNSEAVADDQMKVKEAQAAYDTAIGAQSASQQNVAALEDTVKKDELTVEQLKAGIDPLLERDVATAEDNLKAATMIAPSDGVVSDVKAKQGETLSPGAPLVQLYNPEALEAQCTVTEEDYPLTKVGQSVKLYFDSQPDLVVTGTVASLVPTRDATSASPVYPVSIKLDNVPPGLAPGMTVDSLIQIANRSNVLRLPRALVHARADGTAQIQVWANGKAETRTIKTGLRGDHDVEILSGVSEGEQVISQ